MNKCDVNLLPRNDPAYMAAHREVFDPRVTLLGQLAYAAVVLVMYLLYRPLVPPEYMNLWLFVVLLVFGTVLAFDIAFAIRRPNSDELMRFWRRVDKKVPTAFDLIAVGLLFLLEPFADQDLKVLTVAFFVGYVPMQMISDPENETGTRLSIILVLGSFSINLLWAGGVTERALAVLMIIYGAVLYLSSGILRRFVINAIAERQISERNAAALEVALKQVSDERDAKTMFIATATHDLGQPLMAARLFLEQAAHATTRAERRRADAGAFSALSAADRLLSHMLNALQLQADAVVPQNAVLTLGPVLNSLARQFQAVAERDGVRLTVVNSSKQIFADRSLLDRALGNLINNALTHAHASQIVLGVRCSGQHNLRILVVDNGTGIAKIDAPRLFDDFYQGSTGLSRMRGGFGLGLASVRRIAKLSGGSAGLIADRVGGAAFYVELPVYRGSGSPEMIK